MESSEGRLQMCSELCVTRFQDLVRGNTRMRKTTVSMVQRSSVQYQKAFPLDVVQCLIGSLR